VLWMHIVSDPLGKSARTGLATRHATGHANRTARTDDLVTDAGNRNILAIGHYLVTVIMRQQVADDNKRCSRKIKNAASCQERTICDVGKGRLTVHRGVSGRAVNPAACHYATAETRTNTADIAATHGGTAGIASIMDSETRYMPSVHVVHAVIVHRG